MKLDFGEARKAASSPTSSGLPNRFTGISDAISRTTSFIFLSSKLSGLCKLIYYALISKFLYFLQVKLTTTALYVDRTEIIPASVHIYHPTF